jgi:hypothetical protein
MKDIAAKRTSIINQQHASKLIELGLVEMRDGILYLTIAGQNIGYARCGEAEYPTAQAFP